MKNIMLFVFGTLMVAFAASTIMLYANINESQSDIAMTTSSEGESQSPTKKSFNGQIFVVTRGGESVPLGGVIVAFYTRSEFIVSQYKFYESNGAVVAPIIKKFKEKYDEESKAYSAWFDISLGRSGSSDKLTRARELLEEKTSERKAAYYALLYKTDAKTYVAALPSPFITTQTDANGKFSTSLATEKPLVAVACASRLIGKITENYCWFINMDGTKEVLMNNNNMFGMVSDDQAIPFTALPMECGSMSECSSYVNQVSVDYSTFFPESINDGVLQE